MGSCLSSSTGEPRPPPNNVRIVHLDGYVEDFDYPVFVNQLITSKPPKHFICTPAQLLSPFSKPLDPSARLEPGSLYLMLPFSTLQADVSPANLVSLVKKLMEKAKSGRAEPGIVFAHPGGSLMSTLPAGNSTLMSSPGRSPGMSPGRSPGRSYPPEMGPMGFRSQRSVSAWRPLLDTINEKSFNKRSESDLQERGIPRSGVLIS